jgi:hypothetical protein
VGTVVGYKFTDRFRHGELGVELSRTLIMQSDLAVNFLRCDPVMKRGLPEVSRSLGMPPNFRRPSTFPDHNIR